jgi:hypothetical protein
VAAGHPVEGLFPPDAARRAEYERSRERPPGDAGH